MSTVKYNRHDCFQNFSELSHKQCVCVCVALHKPHFLFLLLSAALPPHLCLSVSMYMYIHLPLSLSLFHSPSPTLFSLFHTPPSSIPPLFNPFHFSHLCTFTVIIKPCQVDSCNYLPLVYTGKQYNTTHLATPPSL